MPTLNQSSNQSSLHTDDGLRTEEQVERLVIDISRVIQAAEPAKRAGLKEMADTLLHEEISMISDPSATAESPPRRSRFNPLASGILLILLGFGIFLVVPFIGVTVSLVGLLLALWGGTITLNEK